MPAIDIQVKNLKKKGRGGKKYQGGTGRDGDLISILGRRAGEVGVTNNIGEAQWYCRSARKE